VIGQLTRGLSDSAATILADVSNRAQGWVDSTAQKHQETLGVGFCVGVWATAFEFALAQANPPLPQTEILKLRQAGAKAFCVNTLAGFYGGELLPDRFQQGEELFHSACEDVRTGFLQRAIAAGGPMKVVAEYVRNSDLREGYVGIDGTGTWAYVALISAATEARI
jgi:hypothetical protein